MIEPSAYPLNWLSSAAVPPSAMALGLIGCGICPGYPCRVGRTGSREAAVGRRAAGKREVASWAAEGAASGEAEETPGQVVDRSSGQHPRPRFAKLSD